MAETDGIEEAAAEVLRTAVMAGAQLAEHVARARQQQSADRAAQARDATRDLEAAGRTRGPVEGVLTRAVDRLSGSDHDADRRVVRPVAREAAGPAEPEMVDTVRRVAAAREVDRVLAADRVPPVAPAVPAPAAVAESVDAPVLVDRGATDPAVVTAAGSMRDPAGWASGPTGDAAEAWALLDRARAHPASAATAEPPTLPGPKGWVAAAHLNGGRDLGR